MDADMPYRVLMQNVTEESNGAASRIRSYESTEAVSGRNIFQRLFDKVYSSSTSKYPLTFEAGVILESLSTLKKATEADLGFMMKYVGLSVPVFYTDLQAAHILTAAEKADKVVWSLGVDALAASVSHGIGICEYYMDSSLCESEHQQLPSDDNLVLYYSYSVLTGALASDLGLSLRFRKTVDSYLINQALGTRHRSKTGAIDWRNVTQGVGAFVWDRPQTITRVILMGSSASEPGYHKTVEAAFNGFPVLSK